MNIGLVIKTLRHERGLTQEKLADYLNVSPQAVSRWECGLALPDITAIPQIASFFEVSCDLLLGTEKDTREERITAILEEHGRLASLGKTQERLALSRDAVREFPGEFRLLIEYAWDLSAAQYDDFGNPLYSNAEQRAVQEEIIGICGRILDDCTDDEIRYSAIDLMSMTYMDVDDEKAEAAANRLPDFWQTRNMSLYRVWDYNTDEHIAFFQDNIADLANLLWLNIRTAVWGQSDPQKKVDLCRKALTVYEAIYENGDYGYYWTMLSQIHETMAEAYLALGDVQTAMEMLETSVQDEENFLGLKSGERYTSLLADHRIFSHEELVRGSELSPHAYFLERMKSARYDGIRETERFKALIETLNRLIERNAK